MEPITISKYTQADYQDWRDMSLQLFKDHSLEEMEQDLQQVLGKPNYQTFMARESGKNVGYVTTSIRTDYVEGCTTFPVGYIDMVFVKPEYRKHGVARMLFECAEAWAKEKGCTEMGSDTWLWNTDAQSFHEKMGFKKEDVLVHYIKTIKE